MVAENEGYDLVSLAQEKDFPEAGRFLSTFCARDPWKCLGMHMEVPISHEVLLAEARKSLLAVSQQMLQDPWQGKENPIMLSCVDIQAP